MFLLVTHKNIFLPSVFKENVLLCYDKLINLYQSSKSYTKYVYSSSYFGKTYKIHKKEQFMDYIEL